MKLNKWIDGKVEIMHVFFHFVKPTKSSFAPEFQCESSCLFYLSFNFDFYVSKIMHL